ncbi:MAG: small ribosomal subunit Rsm22 family protein [Kofleriaceae bacterium]
MSWTVPPALEDAVRAAARAELGPGPLATAALTRAIVDRSVRYTSDRARLDRPADPAGDLAARAAFFTIADAMKIAVPLAELANRGALPAARPLRVVDLGAGCGAMSLGLIAAIAEIDREIPLELRAIDRDAGALAIAARAIPDFAARSGVAVQLATRTADVASAPLGAADLIAMGTLLNELPTERAVAVVERALAAISDDGAVIAIEPALRDTSRALHAVRDAVLARGLGHAFAPCTRRGAPCPALADPDDWCHEDRPLALPPVTAELARLTHLRDSGMKFSYLVLRKQPRALVDVPEGAVAWRVVSAPRPAKGKLELIGCSDRGRVSLRLLKRHRAPGNRELERADRGDAVVVRGAAQDADRVEIDRDTTVEKIDPTRR